MQSRNPIVKAAGQTKVVVIDSNGVRELSPEEVKKNYEDFVSLIATGYAPFFQGFTEDDIKKIWPTG